MANFATLADVLAGCVTMVSPDACDKLFAAATPPGGGAPTDTMAAAQAVAKAPWYQPERLFNLLDAYYPIPEGKTMRAVPFMPYLSFVPTAWVLPLKFDGGGYRAGGKAMFDSEGNLWVGDNFTIGWQGQDTLWQGNASKFAPDGTPLSPITTGFAGGGMQGGTFGAAVDAHDNAWLSSYGGKSIAVFDKTGKPLTPPEGITFDGKLGLMQGIIVTPGGDVWALGVSKSQLLFFPQGDYKNGRIVCEGDADEPCKSFLGLSTWGSTSTTAFGCRTLSAITSLAFPQATRRRSKSSRPAGAAAGSGSTARATFGHEPAWRVGSGWSRRDGRRDFRAKTGRNF